MNKKHTFGGLWTRKKLAVLEAYLSFYSKALKNQPFRLHYADAFAGTGTHIPESTENQEMLLPYEDLSGSVRTALDVVPSFHQYHFNDLNPEHVAELRELTQQYPDKSVQIYQQDANDFVPQFCASLTESSRAVILLDPYSTQLDWDTLKHVAESQKVDLWLLFPISAILRMTPKDGNRIKPEWQATLNRLLGTDRWEDSLYQPTELPLIDDLFGSPDPSPPSERLNTKELENWVTNRLKELFPYVARPVPLNNRGRPLFLFYFAVSNPSKKAWGLAERAATHIINKNIGNE